MKNYLKNSVIYQVNTRIFTKEGTFKALGTRLDYIKSLNTDILYLLPIHPIGKVGRKGTLGSPYSIKDYRAINPEYGSMDDFKDLIKKTHNKNMLIMMDIVFNHTSRDSWILKNHPERMYKNSLGEFSNKAGDWSDVYDLNLDNDDLIQYLVDTIEFYCSIGVDGFRFDVASLLTKKFYIALKTMLNEKYPNTILLAESVSPDFIAYLRSKGLNSLSDGELFELGFDLLYQYTSFESFKKYLTTKKSIDLEKYKEALKLESALTPDYALRIHGLENHDQMRLYEYTSNPEIIRSLASYQVFMKGPMFIYNGLEAKANHLESLFDKEDVDMNIDKDWFNFILKLSSFKKDEKNLKLNYTNVLDSNEETLVLKNSYSDDTFAFGVFPLNGKLAKIVSDELIDGTYIDYLSGNSFIIKNHSITTDSPLFLFLK